MEQDVHVVPLPVFHGSLVEGEVELLIPSVCAHGSLGCECTGPHRHGQSAFSSASTSLGSARPRALQGMLLDELLWCVQQVQWEPLPARVLEG